MMFTRVNRSNPEKILIVAYNSSSATHTNGQPVRWDYTTDVNGVGVEKPQAISTDNRGNTFAGVAVESITAGSYGLYQVYGYHSAVICTPASSDAIALGTPLYLPAASGYQLESHVMAATGSTTIDEAAYMPCAFALQAYTKAGTTSGIKAFIKGMG